jgi:hypothetical protein
MLTTTTKTNQNNTAQLNKEESMILAHYIRKYGEIPKSMKLGASNWKTDNECHSFQMWPDSTNLLYKAKEAFIDFSSLAPKLFENFERVNIFDLYHTNGFTSLPMVISLFEEERLGKYIPVTATRDMSSNAIYSIRQTLILSNSDFQKDQFHTDHITVDIEKADFKTLVRDVMNEADLLENRTLNLYVLGENSLGNLINPEAFLHNVYNSMQTGEKLLIMQAVHRPGVEDLLVEDYIKLLPYMTKTLEVSGVLAEKQSQIVSFDEQVGGIVVDTKIEEAATFESIQLEENQLIRIFRSTRFKMPDLYTMFHRIGFTVNHIMFDEMEDNAVILLSK